jgi:hypothetical protein
MVTACPAGASHDLESEQMMKRFTMKGIYRSEIGLLGLGLLAILAAAGSSSTSRRADSAQVSPMAAEELD